MLTEVLSWHALLTGAAAIALTTTMVKLLSSSGKRLVYGSSQLNEFLAEGLGPVVANYAPAWWTNAHIQILLTFLVPHPALTYKREVLRLADGGQLALDWAVETQHTSADATLRPDSPIVVVFHGLTGCSDAMRSLCAEALHAGYRPVVFNKRGHGGVPLTTPRLQGFGCIRDLKQAIAHIESCFPQATLYGVGLSAGSGLLCSYLGETGEDCRLAAGVLISSGYDALELFCKGNITRVYDYLMTFSLKRLLVKHKAALAHAVDVPAALRATCVREFDERVYMTFDGYADIESYWARNNPLRDVDKIARPVLCINALDDPVCTKENIAYDVFENHPRFMLVETQHGSHCAFYEGSGWRLTSWANGAALAYLTRLRAYKDNAAM